MTVTAAESVLHGGPAALLGAAGADALRAAGAFSLLETSASQGWQLAVALERALARRVPLDRRLARPQPAADRRERCAAIPYEPEALERIARSPFRHLPALLPERGAHAARCVRSRRS